MHQEGDGFETYSFLEIRLQLALALDGYVDHVAGEINAMHVEAVLPGEVERRTARPAAHVKHPLARRQPQPSTEILRQHTHVREKSQADSIRVIRVRNSTANCKMRKGFVKLKEQKKKKKWRGRPTP